MVKHLFTSFTTTKYAHISSIFPIFSQKNHPTEVRIPRPPLQNDCIRHVSRPHSKSRTEIGQESQQLEPSNRHLVSHPSLFCIDLHNQMADCTGN
jgi:hypothetical protein